MTENNIKKRRVMWSEAAETDLIDFWREKMPQLRSASQNQLFYKPSTAMRTV